MYNTLFTYLQYLCRNYMILCHAMIIQSSISIYKKCEPSQSPTDELIICIGQYVKFTDKCSVL